MRIGALVNFRSYTVSVTNVVPDTTIDDQADWTYAPGTSVTLRLEWDETGSPTFDVADTVTIRVRLLGDATNIGTAWSPAISGVSGEATTTMKFSGDPLAASGSDTCGMFEVFLTVQRAAVAAWGPVDSRGGGTPPAATANTWARGKFRAESILSAFSISDASLGGAEPAAFYATKTTFNRATLAQGSYRAISVTLKHRQSAADVRSAIQDAAAGTSVLKDFTWNATVIGSGNKGRINKDYAIAATATDVRIVMPSTSSGGASDDKEYHLAALGHIATWTRLDDSTLEKTLRFTADPRVQFSKLLQLNSNTWAATPSTGNVTSGQRLSADLGFISSRAIDMAPTPAGLNALVWTDKLWDSGNLVGSESSPVKTDTATGTTQGTEAGWGDGATLPITWDNALPGGSWTQKQVITTSDMTGTEVSNTRTLTLLAADPRTFIAVGFGDPANPSDHWSKGKALVIGGSLMTSGQKMTPDSNSLKFALLRFKASTGQLEYLDTADTAVNTWTVLGASGTPTFYDNTTTPAVAASGGDAQLLLLQFSAAQTGQSNWNSQDIFVIVQVAIGSVPYFRSQQFSVLGTGFPHAGAPDGSTLEFSGTTLRVKDAGVTIAKLSFDPATQAELDAVATDITTHAAATTGVHGVGAGAVVGTTTVQTLTNKTLGSNLAAGGFLVTGLGAPVADNDAARKVYVDSIASGLDVKASCRVGTLVALPAYTAAGSGVGKTLTANANGALTVDSVAMAATNRVLVKDEGAGTSLQNGIYTVTDAGSGATPWILTRATDADQNAEVTSGMYTFLSEGTGLANTSWALTTSDPITVDTTALSFTQVSTVPVIAGDGLVKVGNTISVQVGLGLKIESDTVKLDTPNVAIEVAPIQQTVTIGSIIHISAAIATFDASLVRTATPIPTGAPLRVTILRSATAGAAPTIVGTFDLTPTNTSGGNASAWEYAYTTTVAGLHTFHVTGLVTNLPINSQGMAQTMVLSVPLSVDTAFSGGTDFVELV